MLTPDLLRPSALSVSYALSLQQKIIEGQDVLDSSGAKAFLAETWNLRAQLSSTFSLSGKSPRPWLRFDEHLWLAVGFAKRAFDGIHWS